MRSFTGWVALMMNCERVACQFSACAGARISKLSGSDVPYLLGDLSTLLGSALVSSAAGSGVLLCVGLSILLSSLLRMCMREFFLLLRAPRASLFQGVVGAAQQSEIRTGPCTILSVLNRSGEEICRDRGDAKRWVSYVVLNWKVFSRGGFALTLPKCLFGGARKCKSWRACWLESGTLRTQCDHRFWSNIETYKPLNPMFVMCLVGSLIPESQCTYARSQHLGGVLIWSRCGIALRAHDRSGSLQFESHVIGSVATALNARPPRRGCAS